MNEHGPLAETFRVRRGIIDENSTIDRGLPSLRLDMQQQAVEDYFVFHLKITETGFYVEGKKVETEDLPVEVYYAFVDWLDQNGMRLPQGTLDKLNSRRKREPGLSRFDILMGALNE